MSQRKLEFEPVEWHNRGEGEPSKGLLVAKINSMPLSLPMLTFIPKNKFLEDSTKRIFRRVLGQLRDELNELDLSEPATAPDSPSSPAAEPTPPS
jgi:hypothetical protein